MCGNRHRATGTPGPELLSENAILARGDGSMIKTGGIDGDDVPTMERIEPLPRSPTSGGTLGAGWNSGPNTALNLVSETAAKLRTSAVRAQRARPKLFSYDSFSDEFLMFIQNKVEEFPIAPKRSQWSLSRSP